MTAAAAAVAVVEAIGVEKRYGERQVLGGVEQRAHLGGHLLCALASSLSIAVAVLYLWTAAGTLLARRCFRWQPR